MAVRPLRFPVTILALPADANPAVVALSGRSPPPRRRRPQSRRPQPTAAGRIKVSGPPRDALTGGGRMGRRPTRRVMRAATPPAVAWHGNAQCFGLVAGGRGGEGSSGGGSGGRNGGGRSSGSDSLPDGAAGARGRSVGGGGLGMPALSSTCCSHASSCRC